MSNVHQINKENKALHCVQCLEEMPYGTDWDKFVPICTNPKCPNYGLLQMGVEGMSKVEKGE